MAAWYKNQGKTLVDGLNELYAEYGYYLDTQDSFTLKGQDGAEKIKQLMVTFREKGTSLIEGIKELQDISKGVRDLPKDNVLKYVFEDDSWIAVRPSGTEPKIKVYYSIKAETRDAAELRLAKIKEVIHGIIK